LPSLMRDLLPIGSLLRGGTYRIDYALGRGGFGITYRATHQNLEQFVAIKEFYPQEHVVRNTITRGISIPTTQQEAYEKGLQRFLREGRILAKLNHANVVRVQDLFEEQGTAYLVMELVTGKTLKDELESQPERRLPIKRVEEVMEQLVAALEAIHDKEVYHLDLKPDNVLLNANDRAVLVDFGAARQGLTSRSTRAYTEAYAAPEVIAGGDIGPESDIFELGMMLHEMLTGKLPEPALRRLMKDTWEPADLGELWQCLVTAALQLRPEQRPRSVREWWDGRETADTSSFSSSVDFLKAKRQRIVKNFAQERITSRNPAPLSMQVFEFEVLILKTKGQESYICRRQAQYFTENRGNRITLEMVAIPGDTFRMGSPKTEYGHSEMEEPQHSVTVKPFLMGKYPITQAQWQAVAALPQVNQRLSSNPSRFKGANRPVERVSWYDAVEFCVRLSRYTKRNYQLPSEAKWEYACRSGTSTPFHFGETITPDLANYNGKYVYGSSPKGKYLGQTTPVGSFQVANAFGLYDMHGNVWEWCAEHLHDNYEGAPTDGSVWKHDNDYHNRLLRGGSWINSPVMCRSASRNYSFPGDLHNSSFGFRVLCEAAWTL